MIDQDAVKSSVERNIALIGAHEARLTQLLTSDLQNAITQSSGVEEGYGRLKDLAKEAASLVYPHSACGDRCDHCCKMDVTMTNFEAYLVGKAIGVTPKNVGSKIPDRGNEVERYHGVPCVFLKDHRCSIYHDRPMPCVTHFNISSCPDICNIIDYPGHDVPNLNFATVWAAQLQVQMEFVDGLLFADIREFFPEGLNPIQSL